MITYYSCTPLCKRYDAIVFVCVCVSLCVVNRCWILGYVLLMSMSTDGL